MPAAIILGFIVSSSGHVLARMLAWNASLRDLRSLRAAAGYGCA
jgi:hypothetical protein